jgi:hypothetical protein
MSILRLLLIFLSVIGLGMSLPANAQSGDLLDEFELTLDEPAEDELLEDELLEDELLEDELFGLSPVW